LEGLEAFKKPDHDRTSLHDAQRVSLRLHPRRHHIENPFCRLDDLAYIGLRRDKTRRGWIGFAPLAAALVNLRIAESGHRPQAGASPLGRPCSPPAGAS
jgi:hypothetical protein